MGYPLEAKHTGGREPLEVIIARYQPQMQWQMIVTGAKQCALSVIMGANEPIVEMIPRDEEYCAELLRRAKQFWACVESLTPPFVLPPVDAPRLPATVEYDFSTSNEWCSEAFIWLENKEAGKRASAAEKNLKKMVPEDAAKCFGGSVQITRNKAGSLSLREQSK